MTRLVGDQICNWARCSAHPAHLRQPPQSVSNASASEDAATLEPLKHSEQVFQDSLPARSLATYVFGEAARKPGYLLHRRPFFLRLHCGS
jgi:hypothetical protein